MEWVPVGGFLESYVNPIWGRYDLARAGRGFGWFGLISGFKGSEIQTYTKVATHNVVFQPYRGGLKVWANLSPVVVAGRGLLLYSDVPGKASNPPGINPAVIREILRTEAWTREDRRIYQHQGQRFG